MKWSSKPRRPLLAVALGGLLALLVTLAPTVAQAATVLGLRGDVRIERAGQVLTVAEGQVLQEGDEISLGAGSDLVMRFDDGGRLAVRQASRVLLQRLALAGAPAQRRKVLKVIKGGVRYISGEATLKSRVSFETSSVSIGIRGTDIEIAVTEEAVASNPAGTYLKVNTGLAVLSSLDGTQVELEPGQIGFGAEPQLTPRGTRALPRPSARRLQMAPDSVFVPGGLDAVLR